MLIQKIKINNYKTYLDLDLDLRVEDERPIILIGGANGGGKTTLFEAICGALYGLKIANREEFEELLNDGARGTALPEISLQITFVGKVLGQEQKYILKRKYLLRDDNRVVESVSMNMNGNTFVYGTMTEAKERLRNEQQVNKIIKANLPQELSKYFLFDAMQSSELLKQNVFAQTIRDNFENVLGFKKYLQMKRASERLKEEMSKQRLEAEQEAQEYNELCATKDKLRVGLENLIAQKDALYKYLTSVEKEYEAAKQGAKQSESINRKIQVLQAKVNDTIQQAALYADNLKDYVENIEGNVFLPKMAANMSQEINNILHAKESLKKDTGTYPIETLRDVTQKIITYLKDLSLCAQEVEEENVVNYMVALQNSQSLPDQYSYLDDNEINALKRLASFTGNNFSILDARRQELEVQLSNLESNKNQIKHLQEANAGGNEDLIRNYEENQAKLKALTNDENAMNAEIKKLEKRIHQFDVQIQQEPDVRYDTLVKLCPFFDEVVTKLLHKKKRQIEQEMQEQLNQLLISYKGHIGRVELSESMENFNIRLFHTAGNEISLNHLNAASKQIFIQVLLKVLRNLGDYEPPVMIDTVMGVLDEESRDALMEEYFPKLAEQTILLCTTSEIRTDTDYIKLEPFISKTYTLQRDVEQQCTHVKDGYFGKPLNP